MSRCTIVGRGRRLRRIPMLVLRLAGSVSGCSLLGVFLQLCCQSMSWLGTNLVALVILANYRSYFLATERSLSTGVMRSRHRTSAALQRNLREDIHHTCIQRERARDTQKGSQALTVNAYTSRFCLYMTYCR